MKVQIGNATLYLGDCAEVLKKITDESIDLTITSPPYDNLRTYNGFVFDFESIAKELFRVTKQGGVIVWVVGDATVDGSETGTSFKQALYFKEIGFNLHDTMIWEKPNFSNPSTNRYHQIFEYMFVFSKGKPKTFNPILDVKNKYGTCLGKNTKRQANGDLIEVKKNDGREFGMRRNIWKLNTVGQEMMCETPPHPAMFPERLVYDHLISWSEPNDVVFDCFLGSGTTGIVATQNTRKFIGCEISDEYFDIACKRIEDSQRQITLF
jgi:site-specific DNA-methyltransferase (adenine-specific)